MKNDGGPALVGLEVRNGIVTLTSQMSLRDYFAAAALPAIIAAYVEANGRCIGTDHVMANCPSLAYGFADAMLKERDK